MPGTSKTRGRRGKGSRGFRKAGRELGTRELEIEEMEEGHAATYTFWWSLIRFRRTLICKKKWWVVRSGKKKNLQVDGEVWQNDPGLVQGLGEDASLLSFPQQFFCGVQNPRIPG